MKTSQLNGESKWIRVTEKRKSIFAISIYSVANQVNLLAFVVAGLVIFGILTKFFLSGPSNDNIFAFGILVALALVIVFNSVKRHETANVLFYIALNIVGILAFRDLPGQYGEAILLYILLFSLVAFLFEKFTTRLICMAIIVVRILFFELNLRYLREGSELMAGTSWERSRQLFDCVLMAIILFIFIFYALKIRAVESLREKNARLGQHMSHDLQVSYHSVASIINHLEGTVNNNSLLSNNAVLIQELSNASSICSYILNNFLEFSRLERADMETNHYEEFDLSSELERIVELYKYLADEKGVQIVLLLDDSLPGIIFSDKIKVTRIVLNLLSNAIKNTTSGKTITVKVDWRDGPWELSVANESNGLKGEEIQQLFAPYREKDIPSAKRRLGLGLPITKELVEALGGSIKASTHANQETLFTVAFPVK